MKKLKIVIVGNGSIGNKYKQILKDNFKYSKIFLIPSRKFLTNNNISSSYLSLFKKNHFDLAIVCSPANMHIKHSIMLANYKINLLIEKPLSSAISKEIYHLKNIINKNKIICHVGYMFKFSRAAQELKKNILIKKIGNLRYAEIICHSYLPYWRKKNYKYSVSVQKKLGGGVINELSHEIHLSRWFFGIPKIIAAYNFNSEKLDMDCEDNSISILKYSKNFQLFMSLSFSKKNNERYIFISGTKGEIKWDIIKNNIVIKTKKRKKVIKFKYENLYLKQLNYILKIKKHLVSFQEGIDVLKLIFKIKKNI